jgi:Glycoside-hydrolase family GH114
MMQRKAGRSEAGGASIDAMLPVRTHLVLLCSTLALACADAGSNEDAGDGTDPETTASPSTSAADGSTGGTPGTMSNAESPATTDDPGTESSVDPSTTGVSAETSDPTDDTEGPGPVALPPVDGGLDYQLGGSYAPPRGVTILSRDRNTSPEAGLYNICYVNGFQAQPDENDFWLNDHPDLVLRDGNGDPVIDQDWDEMLLDTSTAEKRTALAEIVGGWIAECGSDGYDAVEIDNLDSYSRADGALSEDGAVEYMALLSAASHDAGMAIAQKNSTELVGRAGEMGTDFAVAEECSTYEECGDYVDGYGDAVLMIEYVQGDFATGCADWPGHSIVLRDVELVTPGDGGYVYDAC